MLADLQAVGHVLVHAHVRIERVVLEHHGDVAVLGLELVDHPVADRDLAAGDALEPRHHAQQGGLAAARGTDDDDELAVGDLHVDAVDDLDLVVVGLLHAAQVDLRHRLFLRLDEAAHELALHEHHDQHRRQHGEHRHRHQQVPAGTASTTLAWRETVMTTV